VLALATAIGSAGLAAGGTAGALLSVQLTGTEAAAGLPLGLLVVGQAAAAVLVSRRTSRVGRGRSLALGYVLGAVGGTMVVFSALVGSFVLLLTGSVLLGAGNTAVFMTRYAAAEAGGEAARGKALGAVFSATAVGAVASPGLLGPSGELARTVGLPPLAGLYVVAVACFLVAALLLSAASTPAIPFLGRGTGLLGPPQGVRPTRTEVVSGLGAPSARLAVAVLAATNVVMVAVMAVSPVHMVAHGHGLGVVGIVVSIHVAGMFAPSPISGWAADRFGPIAVAGGGFALILASGIGGLLFDTGSALWMTAILLALGVGWNLGVVGGSTMLITSVTPSLRPHVEGLGEVSMGLAAGAGAPVAGLIVAFGGFAALSMAGTLVAATAILVLAFAPGRPTVRDRPLPQGDDAKADRKNKPRPR
jgi:MFS family permease